MIRYKNADEIPEVVVDKPFPGEFPPDEHLIESMNRQREEIERKLREEPDSELSQRIMSLRESQKKTMTMIIKDVGDF